MADTTPSQDLIDAITSSRDAYFGHRVHLQRTAESERLFADAFTLGADFALDAPMPTTPTPTQPPAAAVPEALRLADKLNSLCVAEFAWPTINEAAVRLRRYHARVAELEAEVEYLRVSAPAATQAEQHRAALESVLVDGVAYQTSAAVAGELLRLHMKLQTARGRAAAPMSAQPSAVEALRHSANEWADMATNGLQWLRNVVDGISDPKEALANMERNLAHCRAVNDAPAPTTEQAGAEPVAWMDDRDEVVSAKWLAPDEATSDYRAVYTTPLYAAPGGEAPAAAPAAAPDALDAERYRWLRDCNSGSLVVMQITGTGEDDWHVLTENDADAAIDAAMAAQGQEGAA